MRLPVDVWSRSGTNLIFELLLPPSVERIVRQYLDGRKVYKKRQRREFIRSKDIVEHLKTTSTPALKFSPWNKYKNSHAMICCHMRHSIADRSQNARLTGDSHYSLLC